MSDTTTNGIRVQVTPKFLPERRHWVITNSEGEEEEVRGEGVVGDKPVLAPGASYDYNSFCNLKTPVGTMHGSYTMVTPSGETFEARIAPFTLAIPYALN